MDEGEVDAMLSTPLPIGPKGVTLKKDDTQRRKGLISSI